MKKLVFIWTMVLLGTFFTCCSKGDDSYYPFDDEREQSIHEKDLEANSSED